MPLSKFMYVARRYPLVPSMMTYSVLYPSANIVQQILFRNNEMDLTHRISLIDWAEVSRFCIYGGLFHAPLVYNWLGLAARLFPKDTLSHLAAKVFMDQTCFAPVGLSTFYVGLGALEGKSWEAIYQEWKQKFPNTWAISVFVWPFLQTINFKFVPMRFRPIYVGVFSFFWTTGLAALKHNDKSPDFIKKILPQ